MGRQKSAYGQCSLEEKTFRQKGRNEKLLRCLSLAPEIKKHWNTKLILLYVISVTFIVNFDHKKC